MVGLYPYIVFLILYLNFHGGPTLGDKVELQTKVLGWLDRVNKA